MTGHCLPIRRFLFQMFASIRDHHMCSPSRMRRQPKQASDFLMAGYFLYDFGLIEKDLRDHL